MGAALYRHLAPLSAAAWQAVDAEIAGALRVSLAARRICDVGRPLGWQAAATGLGRAGAPLETGAPGVHARIRQSLPLIELETHVDLGREDLDDLARGAPAVDLDPAVDAARRAALAEDQVIFHGFAAAGIEGIVPGAEHRLAAPGHVEQWPAVVAEAAERLREAGVGGPRALVLGNDCYTAISRAAEDGYPLMDRVIEQIDGPVVPGLALEGALMLSQRGDDFRIVLGQDFAVGYLDHDDARVRLRIIESLTFVLAGPDAAVVVAPG